MSYWHECISEAFDDAGIVATEEQIETVREWVEGAHENYGMAHGCDVMRSPAEGEADRLRRELATVRAKVLCPECKGSGEYFSQGPYHSASGSCFKCNGEWRVSP